MKCPYCKSDKTKVTESRSVDGEFAIRRRRECEECKKRFTTFEKIKELDLMIVKNDGRRESFNREKLRMGILKACEKRPISMDDIDNVIKEVERPLRETFEKEFSSKEIGELVMSVLKKTDQVAYVRFASVYRKFRDVKEFLEEIEQSFIPARQ